MRPGIRVAGIRRIEAAQGYHVPVERAFAFITNPANWSSFWPGYVRLQPGSRWASSGDTARLVTRLLGRGTLLPRATRRALNQTLSALDRELAKL